MSTIITFDTRQRSTRMPASSSVARTSELQVVIDQLTFLWSYEPDVVFESVASLIRKVAETRGYTVGAR